MPTPDPQTPDPDPYLSDYSMYDDDPPEVKAALDANPAVQEIRRRHEVPKLDLMALHERYLNDPRFHAAYAMTGTLLQVAKDQHVITQSDLLRHVALLEQTLVRDLNAAPPTQEAAQAPVANGDAADAPAEDDEQVQRIVDSLDAWPTGRYVDPHPGASNAPEGIKSGTAPSLTVRFDRAGFQMSVATADGDTTDLSRLADLAEAAIHIEERRQ